MQIHEFDCVLFPIKLWVTKGRVTHSELNEYFEGRNGATFKEESMPDEYSVATTYFVVKKDGSIGSLVVINKPRFFTDDFITHECTHCVDDMCDVIGMPQTKDTGEPRAYYAQWVAKCIKEVIRNNKCKE